METAGACDAQAAELMRFGQNGRFLGLTELPAATVDVASQGDRRGLTAASRCRALIMRPRRSSFELHNEDAALCGSSAGKGTSARHLATLVSLRCKRSVLGILRRSYRFELQDSPSVVVST